MRHAPARARRVLAMLVHSPTARLLGALVLGAAVGAWCPGWTRHLAWMPAAFVQAARMLAYPILFVSVAHGMVSLGSVTQFGRLGWRAILCAEGLTLAALVFGMASAWLLGTGARLHGVLGSVAQAPFGVQMPALGVGSLLAVLAGACGLGAWALGYGGRRAALGLDYLRGRLLRVLRALVLLAPLPAFAGAAALTSAHGWRVFVGMADVVGGLYLASGAYVLLVLGAVCLACRVNLLRLLAGLKEEILLVSGTAASVSAIDGLMKRLEQAGCSPGAVRILVPLNFVVGLNGSALYLGFALVTLLHAAQLPLTPYQYVQVAALAALTIKSACGVAGSAYVALGLTLTGLPAVPVEGLALLLGLERLLKCRSLTNLAGNAVTSIAVCTWSGELRRVL
jgi:aerobic C4-dicarboxylate transport protein